MDRSSAPWHKHKEVNDTKTIIYCVEKSELEPLQKAAYELKCKNDELLAINKMREKYKRKNNLSGVNVLDELIEETQKKIKQTSGKFDYLCNIFVLKQEAKFKFKTFIKIDSKKGLKDVKKEANTYFIKSSFSESNANDLFNCFNRYKSGLTGSVSAFKNMAHEIIATITKDLSRKKREEVSVNIKEDDLVPDRVEDHNDWNDVLDDTWYPERVCIRKIQAYVPSNVDTSKDSQKKS